MQPQQSQIQGVTLLFNNSVGHSRNNSISEFINSLDVKIMDKMNQKSIEYNFNFEQGRP